MSARSDEDEDEEEQTAQECARLLIVLQLLRDAGADDLAEQCCTQTAQLLYHDLVHAVGRAAEGWREAGAGSRKTEDGREGVEA